MLVFLYPLGFLSTDFSMCSHPSEFLYSTFSNIGHIYKLVQTPDCQVWSSCGNPWACGSLDPSTKNPSPTWLYRPLRFMGWALNTVLIFLVHKARQSSCCQTGVFVFWMIRTLTCSQFRLIINTLDILLSLKEERIKTPPATKSVNGGLFLREQMVLYKSWVFGANLLASTPSEYSFWKSSPINRALRLGLSN